MLENKAIVRRTKDLDVKELLNIMKERVKVFVVEQNCPYQEIDDEDNNAIHVFLKDEDEIAAYSRIIEYEDYYTFGRVLVTDSYRKKGLGRKIVDLTIQEIKSDQLDKPIKIQAQAYLEEFYKSFGFVSVSDTYLEDNIPHLDMELIKE